MRYEIYRTSTMFGSEKPCDNAEYSKEDDCWYIEINTLQELIDLQSKVDSYIILGKEHIEIYDDYRE